MIRNKRTSLMVGLAIGGGTGPEIARVFKTALTTLAGAHGVPVRFEICPRRYRTYASVAWDRLSSQQAARISNDDAAAYEDFLLEQARIGSCAVFRTAFNAQPLYRIRERLGCVKIESLRLSPGNLLLIRDEAQGFYGGENNRPSSSGDVIRRTCEFRRDITERILDFSIEMAAACLGGRQNIDRIFMVYKFHLLDNRFARWVGEYARAKNLKIDLLQPDTMNRLILRRELRGNVLVIGSNEWLDIMHADLLARFGGFIQDERYSWNVYLDPRLRGIIEYQTVHGSADDIAGRGIVNPIAAIRVAAALLERYGNRPGIKRRMDRAIGEAQRLIRAKRGSGGSPGTFSGMKLILERYRILLMTENPRSNSRWAKGTLTASNIL